MTRTPPPSRTSRCGPLVAPALRRRGGRRRRVPRALVATLRYARPLAAGHPVGARVRALRGGAPVIQTLLRRRL